MSAAAMISVIGKSQGITLLLRSPRGLTLDLFFTTMCNNIQYKIVRWMKVDNGTAYTIELYGDTTLIEALCTSMGWKVRWL